MDEELQQLVANIITDERFGAAGALEYLSAQGLSPKDAVNAVVALKDAMDMEQIAPQPLADDFSRDLKLMVANGDGWEVSAGRLHFYAVHPPSGTNIDIDSDDFRTGLNSLIPNA